MKNYDELRIIFLYGNRQSVKSCQINIWTDAKTKKKKNITYQKWHRENFPAQVIFPLSILWKKNNDKQYISSHFCFILAYIYTL